MTWDVVDVDTQTALAACAEGVLETIDWAKLGLDRSKFIGGDCRTAPLRTSSTARFWLMTRPSDSGATKMADLFDLAAFSGKRGLQKSPFVNLEWALIAMACRRPMSTRCLARRRAWTEPSRSSTPSRRTSCGGKPAPSRRNCWPNGQVAITSAWNGRIFNAMKTDGKPFKIIWDQQGLDWDWWSIPKGTPKVEEAYRFISFASQTRAHGRADQVYLLRSRPTRMRFPTSRPTSWQICRPAPANMETALIVDLAVLGRPWRRASRAVQRLACAITAAGRHGELLLSVPHLRQGWSMA